MTKKEKIKVIKAINFFLDEDPDKWTDGINELYKLVYGVTWTDYIGLNNVKSVSIADLIKRRNKG